MNLAESKLRWGEGGGERKRERERERERDRQTDRETETERDRSVWRVGRDSESESALVKITCSDVCTQDYYVNFNRYYCNCKSPKSNLGRNSRACRISATHCLDRQQTHLRRSQPLSGPTVPSFLPLSGGWGLEKRWIDWHVDECLTPFSVYPRTHDTCVYVREKGEGGGGERGRREREKERERKREEKKEGETVYVTSCIMTTRGITRPRLKMDVNLDYFSQATLHTPHTTRHSSIPLAKHTWHIGMSEIKEGWWAGGGVTVGNSKYHSCLAIYLGIYKRQTVILVLFSSMLHTQNTHIVEESQFC